MSSRIEGFVAFTSPALVLLVHSLILVVSGVLGLWYPLAGVLLCSLATASLVAESSGRFSLLRWALPKSASYNLEVWDDQPKAKGVLVVTAPLDVPKWRPDRPTWLRRPLRGVLWAACIVTLLLGMRALAEPWGRPSQGVYTAALLVLAGAVLMGTVAHRRSGGAEEDASGIAAALELLRVFQERPPQGLAVWFVFTGCGHAYQNGMHAFLAMRRPRLEGRTVLVLTFNDPGTGPLGAVVREGPMFPESQRPTGPALAERLRWAGVQLEEVDSETITDAGAAARRGYRGLALVGDGRAVATAESTLGAVEIAESLCRLYAEDIARVPTRTVPESVGSEVPVPDSSNRADLESPS